MRVVKEWPPNAEEIHQTFDLRGFHPVFTYGNKIYNPFGLDIPDDLMVHEQTHEKQQQGMGPENWWKLYLEDENFRLEQEAEAYQAQAEYAKENYNRSGRRRLKREIIKNLSSKLYGNLITKEQAKEVIYG